MTRNSIALILCWWSISAIAMQETLREKAADALIKKWLDLPGLELPTVQEIARIPSDIQNDLIAKMQHSVYQFFVQKAVWDVAKPVMKHGTYQKLYIDNSNYTDAKIEMLPNETVTSVVYTDDLNRALVQLKNTQNNNGGALLYILDPRENKYKLTRRFFDVFKSTISATGKAIALYKGKSDASDMHTIQIRTLRNGTEANYDASVMITKALAAEQECTELSFYHDDTILACTINYGTGANGAFFIWKIENTKSKEVFTLKGSSHNTLSKNGQILLTIPHVFDATGVLNIYKLNENNVFDLILNEPTTWLSKKVLSPDGQVLVLMENVNNDLSLGYSPYKRLSIEQVYSRQNRDIDQNSHLRIRIKRIAGTAGTDMQQDVNGLICNVQDYPPAFISSNEIQFHAKDANGDKCTILYNIQTHVWKKFKNMEFVDAVSGLYMKNEYVGSNPSLYTMQNSKKNAIALRETDIYELRFLKFGDDATCACITSPNYLCYYRFAGKLTNNLKVLRDGFHKLLTFQQFQQTLLLYKMTTMEEAKIIEVHESEAYASIETMPDAIKEMIVTFFPALFTEAKMKKLPQLAVWITRELEKRSQGPIMEMPSAPTVIASTNQLNVQNVQNLPTTPSQPVPVQQRVVEEIPGQLQQPPPRGNPPNRPSKGILNRVVIYVNNIAGWLWSRFWRFFGYQ